MQWYPDMRTNILGEACSVVHLGNLVGAKSGKEASEVILGRIRRALMCAQQAIQKCARKHLDTAWSGAGTKGV